MNGTARCLARLWQFLFDNGRWRHRYIDGEINWFGLPDGCSTRWGVVQWPNNIRILEIVPAVCSDHNIAFPSQAPKTMRVDNVAVAPYNHASAIKYVVVSVHDVAVTAADNVSIAVDNIPSSHMAKAAFICSVSPNYILLHVIPAGVIGVE